MTGATERIEAFEAEVGFRVEFPSAAYRLAQVGFWLSTLQENKKSLVAEARRFDRVVASSEFNSFSPELDGHQACLDKIEALKAALNGKSAFIGSLVVASGAHAPALPTRFSKRELWLNCGQSIGEIAEVINKIN